MTPSIPVKAPTALPAVLLMAALGAAPAVAQNATPAALRTEYLADMKEVEGKIVSLAEAFAADKYSWRPVGGGRSVSEVLMHVASEHYVDLPASVGAKPPADLNLGTDGGEILGNLAKVTDKAEVIRHLKAAFAYQKSVLDAADLSSGRTFGKRNTISYLFTAFVADQHEHLGQLIAYARMNRVVPPWSK